MSRTLELTLTRWLELYPDPMGFYEQDQDRLAEADGIRGTLVAHCCKTGTSLGRRP